MNNELALPPEFALRLAGAGDVSFLFELFCSARTELALLPLPQVQLEQLMRQQYEWQQNGYASQYPDANTWIIKNDSMKVGKITLFETAGLVHIVDFIIAPNWRSQGIGNTILETLKNHVANNSCVLRLSVDRQNIHAKRLYLRCGFAVSQMSDTHEQLSWPPIEQ